jgi:hypothetical protein
MADSTQFRMFPKSSPTLATSAGKWTLRRYGVVFPVKFGGVRGALGFPQRRPFRAGEKNTAVQKALTWPLQDTWFTPTRLSATVLSDFSSNSLQSGERVGC